MSEFPKVLILRSIEFRKYYSFEYGCKISYTSVEICRNIISLKLFLRNFINAQSVGFHVSAFGRVYKML